MKICSDVFIEPDDGYFDCFISAVVDVDPDLIAIIERLHKFITEYNLTEVHVASDYCRFYKGSLYSHGDWITYNDGDLDEVFDRAISPLMIITPGCVYWSDMNLRDIFTNTISIKSLRDRLENDAK